MFEDPSVNTTSQPPADVAIKTASKMGFLSMSFCFGSPPSLLQQALAEAKQLAGQMVKHCLTIFDLPRSI